MIRTYTTTYRCSETRSFYGGQSFIMNKQRNRNGTLYQGAASGQLGTTGDQFALILMPFSRIRNDLRGATIQKIEFFCRSTHAWYNAGGWAILGWGTRTSPYWGASPLGNSNAARWQMGRTQSMWRDVTGALRGNIGTNLTMLMLGPSNARTNASDLNNYMNFTGGTGSNGPALRITYRK